MLITQQQVLGKTKNKRKMLKKELWKGSQLTYLVKVSQLISNSQKLKLVKKTGRLIHTGTQMLLLFQGDSHCTKKNKFPIMDFSSKYEQIRSFQIAKKEKKCFKRFEMSVN